jgi:di/tricarboxylate transporter
VNFELIGTFSVLGVAVTLFLTERLRPDVVALATVAALAGIGVLTAPESFSGFSSQAVITLISVFILAEGLTRTGVSDQAARLLLRWGGRREGRLVGLVMAAGAGLSLFLNNIAAAAVLLPAAGGAARKAGISPSKVLMPLAFATILGGMATLLTTMNIVVSSVLEEAGHPGFGLLEFLPVGFPMLVAGILYMTLWGRRRLPSGEGRDEVMRAVRGEADLLDIYRMADYFFRARIPETSYLIGKTLARSTFREAYGLNVVAVEKRDGQLNMLQPDTVFETGDILVLEGDAEDFRRRDREPYLEILPCPTLCEKDLQTISTVFAEAMLSPRSSLTGRTVREVMFRQKFGMSVLAVWRQGKPIREDIGDLKLEFGDALLLQGPRDRLKLIDLDPDLILLSMERDTLPVRKMGRIALLILAATLASVVFTPVPMAQLLLTGAVLMLLAGAVTMEQAYRAVDWRGIFLVAGMLPLALALTKSGAAAMTSSVFVSVFGQFSPVVIVAALFLASAALTQAVSGAAVAAIMAPIAISAAAGSGAPPHALGMAVALGSSMAFLTPLGHPVNTLVMGAGGYRFSDYRRVGWPLFLILTVVAIAGMTLRWKLFQL